MAVTQEPFTDKAKAGRAGRSNAKRPTNSAAICWASAALPPLPKIKSLFPRFSACTRMALTFAAVDISSLLLSMDCFVAIDASIKELTRRSKSVVSFIHSCRFHDGFSRPGVAFAAPLSPSLPPRQAGVYVRGHFADRVSAIYLFV